MSSIEDWYERARMGMGAMAEQSKAIEERAREARASVSDKSGRIKVTVDRHGKLMGLSIHPRAFEVMSAEALAETILTISSEAATALGRRIVGEYRKVWGVDASSEDVRRGAIDPLSFARQVRRRNFGDPPRTTG
ncbi:YbaB/EbfC family nucleoid-associated protein [Stackebrandtia soli]|uniref:YbaB/EbfC family nucleoid-associated protein n=1 Tax=Stackebrandtia soli TaxID=1892856 RepID=UPI0039EC12DD